MVYIINEARDKKFEKGASSNIVVFYHHCLKWVYQPKLQDTSWIKSIIESSKQAKEKIDGNKITIRVINESLRDLYNSAIPPMRKDTRITKSNIELENYVWNSFDTLDKILDEQYVRAWLIQNAYSDEIVEAVNNKK